MPWLVSKILQIVVIPSFLNEQQLKLSRFKVSRYDNSTRVSSESRKSTANKDNSSSLVDSDGSHKPKINEIWLSKTESNEISSFFTNRRLLPNSFQLKLTELKQPIRFKELLVIYAALEMIQSKSIGLYDKSTASGHIPFNCAGFCEEFKLKSKIANSFMLNTPILINKQIFTQN